MIPENTNPILFVTNGKTPPMDMTTGLASNKAVKTPLFETENCHCQEIVANPLYYNTKTSFKCRVHGLMVIDRRPLAYPASLQFPPTPVLQIPKSPFGQPQWGGNGILTGGSVNSQSSGFGALDSQELTLVEILADPKVNPQ